MRFGSIYLRLGGPPRVRAATFRSTAVAGLAVPLLLLIVVVGTVDLPGLGNLTPSLRSSLTMICELGTALPDSYSAITCGFSLMAVAKSF
jgi:hypothetical protein